MTTDQIIAGTKTVTRRFGWQFLKSGDLVQPVRKAMGLKKGDKIEPLREPIRIKSVRREPLNAIALEDCGLEGFPEMSPADFVSMLVKKYRCSADAEITRIEFEYTEGEKS
ncbi:ASCH domain-containing protein [Desulforegula conservatrix]|uniref:ASCH domain-containing protein n=1 Tax=Desulforegula conservatrix TaxID=153026 RepID=UPI0004038FDB|nr:ASCH domain-containing protein [Desulforegula conservatrix]